MGRTTPSRRKPKPRPADDNGPDYILKMKARDSDKAWAAVGAGWLMSNKRGVSVRLRMGVVLDWHDFGSDFSLILVPADDNDHETEIPF